MQILLLICFSLLVPIFGPSLDLYGVRIPTNGEDIGVVIVGTIANRDESSNVALVKETRSGKVHAVKKGYLLLKDYVVREVHAKFMVLGKGAKRFLVYQNKFAGEFNRTASRGPINSALMGDQYNEDGFERNGNKISVSASYRDKLVNEDLSKILMQATAIPKMEGGQIVGFSLLQIDAGSIYDKAGLKNHDVVTAINGVKLTNAAGAIKLLKSLKGSDGVTIDLKRNGVAQQLELNVSN